MWRCSLLAAAFALSACNTSLAEPGWDPCWTYCGSGGSPSGQEAPALVIQGRVTVDGEDIRWTPHRAQLYLVDVDNPTVVLGVIGYSGDGAPYQFRTWDADLQPYCTAMVVAILDTGVQSDPEPANPGRTSCGGTVEGPSFAFSSAPAPVTFSGSVRGAVNGVLEFFAQGDTVNPLHATWFDELVADDPVTGATRHYQTTVATEEMSDMARVQEVCAYSVRARAGDGRTSAVQPLFQDPPSDCLGALTPDRITIPD